MPKTCPICKKPEVRDYEPFCSKRCSDVDLSRWLGNGYAIAGEPLEDIPGGEGEALRRAEPDAEE